MEPVAVYFVRTGTSDYKASHPGRQGDMLAPRWLVELLSVHHLVVVAVWWIQLLTWQLWHWSFLFPLQGGQVLLRPNSPRHLLLPPAARGAQRPEAGERGLLREAGCRQAHRLRLQQPIPAREDAQHLLRLTGLLCSWNTAGGRVRRSCCGWV